MTFSTAEINLEAFLYALTLQSGSLPEPLQKSFQQVGQALQHNQPGAAHRLREEIKRYPPLESAYEEALFEWDQRYTSQQRTKNANIVFSETSDIFELFVSQVLPTHDWVETVKSLSDQYRESSKNIFWDAITYLKQRMVDRERNNVASQRVETQPMMTYGKFSSPKQSSEADFKLAEFNDDTEDSLNWSSTL